MLSYSGIFRKAVLFPLVWALTHATLVIWQANWLQVAPGMQVALDSSNLETQETIKLGLVE